MIAYLSGVVASSSLENTILDVGGVGYGVRVTANDASGLTTGKEAKLYIYEHIREDQHELFGFVSESTKQLFEQLLSVKNVGPKVALAVLDLGNEAIVRSAIAGGEVKHLQTAKGVGKRAAEQIVVELRDKVGLPSSMVAEEVVGRGAIDGSDEAIQALVALGYSESDAQTALSKIDKNLDAETRIKHALRGNF